MSGIKTGEIESVSGQIRAPAGDAQGAGMGDAAPGGSRAASQPHHIRIHHAYSPLRHPVGAVERLGRGP